MIDPYTIDIPTGWSPPVKGIFVGGCVQRPHKHGELCPRLADPQAYYPCMFCQGVQEAHTHGLESPIDLRGWICVVSSEKLIGPLLYHEYAHALNPGQWHTVKWRDTFAGFGYTEEAYA